MPVPNWIIRPANTADAKTLWHIDQHNNPHAWQLEHFQAAIARQRVDIIEKEGQILAYAIWQTVLDEAELHLLLTDQQHRKQGLASALLRHFFHSETTVQRIILEVRISNAPAIELYQKNGFTTVAKRKNYYILPTEDALIMERLC